jgi:iron complex transport system substrate-binding protein
MKKAGVNVVSLYPERLEEFDEYIEKLGMLTGKSEIAAEKLDDFHSQIEEIQNRTKNIESKVKVYFESSEADYKTVTADSMPGKAMEMAGGMNIARDVKPIKEGSSIAPYGIEKILERADEIDVFVSQVGVMNAGGNEHSIKIRPGFDTIKAVKNNRICVINQKIISSPTFRYVKGVKELARMFYPQVFDDISKFDQEEMITREQMAELVIRFKNKSIFVPTSKYYNKKQKGHTYGFFEDVKIDDRNFDFIETAVVSGYMEGKKEDNIEKFYPQNQVTREELAQILYLVSELENKNTHREIGDLTLVSNAKIVQMVVDYGLMDLEEGNFNPNEPVAGKEAVKALRQLKNE